MFDAEAKEITRHDITLSAKYSTLIDWFFLTPYGTRNLSELRQNKTIWTENLRSQTVIDRNG